jgi:hypothetical protein
MRSIPRLGRYGYLCTFSRAGRHVADEIGQSVNHSERDWGARVAAVRLWGGTPVSPMLGVSALYSLAGGDQGWSPARVDWHVARVGVCPVLKWAALTGLPVSVQWEPLRGTGCVRAISPHPLSGTVTRLSCRRSDASSGRSAAARLFGRWIVRTDLATAYQLLGVSFDLRREPVIWMCASLIFEMPLPCQQAHHHQPAQLGRDQRIVLLVEGLLVYRYFAMWSLRKRPTLSSAWLASSSRPG